MARLKVKQISDFTTAVQTLIDNDVDQNAGDISSALSAGVSAGVNADGVQTNLNTVSDALSVEVSSTNSDVVRIDALLASAAGGADVTAVSNALSVEISSTNSDVVRIDAAVSTEISSTNSDVTRIDGLLASVATDGELSTEVASIDTRISNEESTRSADVKAVSDAVVAILDGSTTDLDQFAEVISYVDSLDTADGGALTSQIASLESVVSTNTSSDVVLSNALSAEIDATSADVLSIETVLGTMGTSSTITAISNGLSSEIAATNSDVTRIDAVIASAADAADVTAISTALSSEVSATNADVTSLENLIGTADDMAHEFGTFRGVTSFAIANAVQFQGTDDLLVFVNGHNIHPLTGGEEAGVGYQTADGLTFNFTNIGYDLEATDTFYVTGKKA